MSQILPYETRSTVPVVLMTDTILVRHSRINRPLQWGIIAPPFSDRRGLRTAWAEECDRWLQRDFSAKRYVYFWAGGVYFQPHLKHDKQCLLVITGADEIGNKDIVGLSDGYRESEQSWFELLLDLKRRGLQPLFLDAFLHLAAQAVEALVKRLTFADEVGDHEARAGALVRFLSSDRFKDKRKPAGPFS